MSSKKTLSIIKPDAIKSKYHGNIVDFLENKGFKILVHKKLKLSKPQAEAFYEVHKERPFYNDLVNFMISGEIVAQVLEAENDTLRKLYGSNIQCNAVHGSDSDENASKEISFFFSKLELIN